MIGAPLPPQVTSTPSSADKASEAVQQRNSLPPGWYARKELPMTGLVKVAASHVRLGAEDLGGAAATDELAGFGTDAAISGGRGGCASSS